MREAGSALAGVAAVGLVLALAAQGASAEKATVIELTQIPCQFIGSENGVDHGFTTTKKADRDAINPRTGAERLAMVLELTPGTYFVRVTNKNVPDELGFRLREFDCNWRNPVHHLARLPDAAAANHAAPLRAKGQSAPPGPFSGIMGAPVGSMGWGAGKRGSRR